MGTDNSMRCLFCKSDSSASRSVEHIIPESLGNTRSILPRGVVCDRCNNYFARKVEAPFLESPGIRNLRFYQGLENKRGRVPSVPGIITPDIPVLVTRHPRDDFTSLDVPLKAIAQLIEQGRGELLLSAGSRFPEGLIVSRFLAKIALEAMAERLVAYPEGLEYLVDEIQLDALRNHARLGQIDKWPIHVRTIYAQDASVAGINGKREQVVHEYDFLLTPWNEWYFVLAIFGVEFAINLGGPDIDGYLRWLSANKDVSPLYGVKHGGKDAMPRK